MGVAVRRVLIDTNVFFSAWVLDLVMSMADAKLLASLWSDEILSEFARVADRLGRTDYARNIEDAVTESYPDSCVGISQGDIDGIELPDADDRQVVAAAIQGGCDTIVTFNLKDFPSEVLGEYGLRAMSPDDLMMELADEQPLAVIDAVLRLISMKSRPERTLDEEIEGLRRCRMLRFAEWLDS